MRASFRILTALGGALLLRYPFWMMLFDSGDLQATKPWANGYKMLCTYDCVDFTRISANYTPEVSAHFPGFPLLIAGVGRLFPSFGAVPAALLLSFIFTVIAGAVALFYAERLWGPTERSKDGKSFLGFSNRSWLFLVLISVFPDGALWMRGYSEGLFATLFFAALLCSVSENWLLSCFWCGLLAVVRPQGVWVAAVLGACVLYAQWKARRERRHSILYLLGSFVLLGLPFGIFCSWLMAKTGNPFYFIESQKQWGRHIGFFAGLIEYRPRFDIAVAYLYFSILAGYFFLKRNTSKWRFLGGTTLALSNLPLFVGGFFCYPRFMSTNFGMFAWLTELTDERPMLYLPWILWCLGRLAVAVYHSGFGLFVG